MLVWAVTAAAGGGLTLWLQDSAETPGPYGWEEATPVSQDPEAVCPVPTPLPPGGGVVDYSCIVTDP